MYSQKCQDEANKTFLYGTNNNKIIASYSFLSFPPDDGPSIFVFVQPSQGHLWFILQLYWADISYSF